MTTDATTSLSSPTTLTTTQHYVAHKTAESYEQAYFYEPGAYMEHLVDLTLDALGLIQSTSSASTKQQQRQQEQQQQQQQQQRRVLLDIGGGTGNFATALIAAVDDASTAQKDIASSSLLSVRVVDPFLEPTATATFTGDASRSSDVSFVKARAEDFLQPPPLDDNADGVSGSSPSPSSSSSSSSHWWRRGYHQVLLKEVVHHLQPQHRVGVFRGIREGLVAPITNDARDVHPSILIITRPRVDIDYPLWDEARTVWKNDQPSERQLSQELREAGFTRVRCKVESYPCAIPLERWQEMVRTRFWSTFSHFSNDELETACQTIAETHVDRTDGRGRLHFEDRLVFLTAA